MKGTTSSFTFSRGALVLSVVLSLSAVLIAPWAECQDDQPIETIREKAMAGDPQAQYELGRAYSKGVVVPEDKAEAVRWYRKAAEQGHADAQYALATSLVSADGVAQDKAEAVRWLRKAAAQGDASAKTLLGVCYRNGWGVKRDAAAAARWYREAAEQGNPHAQINLGLCCFRGEGVARDRAEAVRLLRAAAEQGVGLADTYSILGESYYFGDGAEQDKAEAVRWFRKAADQGDADAQARLGLALANGEGVAQDKAEAVRWYRKAAEQGDAFAQFNLAVMYHNGEGVAQDRTEAVRWYRKAAEQGQADAQFNLAVMYAKGEGDLLRSGAAAADWYFRAGESFLRVGKKDDALLCVERIRNLTSVLGLTVPNSSLADELLKATYGAKTAPARERKGPAKPPTAMGTAWMVAPGLFVTCDHVVRGRAKIRLLLAGGASVDAVVFRADRANDLVLLRAGQPLPGVEPLTVAAAEPDPGAAVFTVGFPNPSLQGEEAKVTSGIVSALSGPGDDVRMMQVTVAIQPGNSGGPLVNMRGEILGVVSAKLDAAKVFGMTGSLPENVNYAVKASYLLPLLSAAGVRAPTAGSPQRRTDDLESLAKKVRQSVILVVAE